MEKFEGDSRKATNRQTERAQITAKQTMCMENTQAVLYAGNAAKRRWAAAAPVPAVLTMLAVPVAAPVLAAGHTTSCRFVLSVLLLLLVHDLLAHKICGQRCHPCRNSCNQHVPCILTTGHDPQLAVQTSHCQERAVWCHSHRRNTTTASRQGLVSGSVVVHDPHRLTNSSQHLHGNSNGSAACCPCTQSMPSRTGRLPSCMAGRVPNYASFDNCRWSQPRLHQPAQSRVASRCLHPCLRPVSSSVSCLSLHGNSATCTAVH